MGEPAPATLERPDAFICYSRRDLAFVSELLEKLRGRLIVWVDEQGIYVWESNGLTDSRNEDVNGKDLIDSLRARLGRNLASEEWEKYFPAETYRQTFGLFSDQSASCERWGRRLVRRG
jgi:hypothetical protein